MQKLLVFFLIYSFTIQPSHGLTPRTCKQNSDIELIKKEFFRRHEKAIQDFQTKNPTTKQTLWIKEKSGLFVVTLVVSHSHKSFRLTDIFQESDIQTLREKN